ncbi:hypothetical protein V4F39_02050 [Aquincola sp. MAHUQ-54]|uniref:Uncharacterized protein n=1 Tax=Aquincola agrisoli TaxID=3119538 RepID=A0AAW9QAF2_9BURK
MKSPAAALALAALTTLACPVATAQWTKELIKDDKTGESYRRYTLSSTASPPGASGGVGRKGQLVMRTGHFPGGIQLSLRTEQGRFVCPVGPDFCQVRIRFDAEPPFVLPAVRPADGSSDRLFMRDDGRFMAGAATAQTIVVEAAYLAHGIQALAFAAPGGLEGPAPRATGPAP